jgi:hypothetical protein
MGQFRNGPVETIAGPVEQLNSRLEALMLEGEIKDSTMTRGIGHVKRCAARLHCMATNVKGRLGAQ